MIFDVFRCTRRDSLTDTTAMSAFRFLNLVLAWQLLLTQLLPCHHHDDDCDKRPHSGSAPHFHLSFVFEGASWGDQLRSDAPYRNPTDGRQRSTGQERFCLEQTVPPLGDHDSDAVYLPDETAFLKPSRESDLNGIKVVSALYLPFRHFQAHQVLARTGLDVPRDSTMWGCPLHLHYCTLLL